MPELNLINAFAVFPVLETPRLILRQPTLDDDIEAMYRIMSDARVTRYFGQLPITTREKAEQRIVGFTEAFAQQEGIRWMITSRESRLLLGTCGFWRIDERHLRAEIGYELAPEAWGQGIMTEALQPVLAFGFNQIQLHSAEAQIHPANMGSRRVLEKLGFVQEGYFRENYYDPVEEGFTDTVVFSLLKRDYFRTLVLQ